MRVVALAAVFCVVFLVSLAARTPLEPLLALAGVEQRGLLYEDARGTLWGGEIRGLRVGPERLGDARLGVDASSLLRGRVRAAFEIRGALRARGVAQYAPGSGWLVEDAQFVVAMTDMGDLHPQLRERGGELYARLDRALLDRTRTCVTAEGVIRTDVLSRLGDAAGGWRGPALEGVIACEQGDLVLRLAGADERARVTAEARIDLASGSTFVARVETEDPQVRFALAALGFSEQEGSLSYVKDTVFTDG